MAYDGLLNYSIVKELDSKIINGKIDKIYQPNYEEIILGIYCQGVKYALNLNVNSQYYRANLTTNLKPNPESAPNFCMILRKYLLGTHISKIYTNNLERIIFIEFEGFNKSKDFSTKTLIVELMGKHSNIILVNKDNMIIDSLKHFSLNTGSYRNIFSGAEYELPKSDKIDLFDINDKDEFYRVLKNNALKLNNTKISAIISNTFTGISKNSILYIEKELQIDDNLTNDFSNLIFNYLKHLILDTSNVTCISFKQDYALHYNELEKKGNAQINYFIDDYYTQKETYNTFITYRNNLLKLILNKLSKLNEKLDALNEKLKECEETEKFRLYGELITANLYKINNYNTDHIELENYYDNNSLITIPLDKSISPSANAKHFFKKYQKLKNAKGHIDSQKLLILNSINYFEKIVEKINTANNIYELDKIYSIITGVDTQNKKRKTNKKSKIETNMPITYNIDGYTVLVGKNNKQNDYLTTKIANSNDIWLHVKDIPGSHVIIRSANKVPSPETIYKCAKIAKEHSKASQTSNVAVDYTLVKYVKKPSNSKPGMVTYTHEKTIIVKY